MRQTHHTPCAADVLQTSQQEPAETMYFFDLANHSYVTLRLWVDEWPASHS
jgi:hypothetical protein